MMLLIRCSFAIAPLRVVAATTCQPRRRFRENFGLRSGRVNRRDPGKHPAVALFHTLKTAGVRMTDMKCDAACFDEPPRFAGVSHPSPRRSLMNWTTNKHTPEGRERAVRMVLNGQGQHESR